MSRENRFCIVPFVHFSMKPNGDARICCASTSGLVRDDDGKVMNVNSHSIKEIWNSRWMQNTRAQMLSGEEVSACKTCYENESFGQNSKRVVENRKFKLDIDRIFSELELTGTPSVQLPVYFDLRLGNKCNLKCRTCNPLFSSAWQNEYSRHKEKPEYKMYQEEYQNSLNGMRWAENKEIWQTFFENAGEIVELYITGGEPLLIEEHFILLEELCERGLNEKVILRYNTNLSVLPERFLELASKFKNVKIGCSFDAVGARSDWLRHPSKWSRLAKNFETLLQRLSNAKISINCTVSVFSVLYLEELFRFSREVSSIRPIEVTLDILHEPHFMNFDYLPLSIRREAIQRIDSILNSFQLLDVESSQLRQLRSQLCNLPYIPNDKDRLKNHIETVDKVRGEKFAEVFPELAEIVQHDNSLVEFV